MSTRLKDWAKTTTAPASDDYLAVDGATNGSRKILDSAYKTDVAADFVAAPTTYKIAPLNGSNKIDATYLPTSGDTPLGDWLADNTAPVLSDGTGTAGDYYDVTDDNSGTVDQGAGSLTINGATVAVGDRMKYDGSNWFLIPQVSNLFDGTSTQAGAATAGDYYQTADVNARTNARQPINGVYFNGSDSLLTITDDAAIQFGEGDFSFTGTIKTDGEPASNDMVFQTRGAGSTGVSLYFTSNYRLVARVNDGSNTDTITSLSTYAVSGEIYRWALTADRDGDLTLYVNGEVAASTAMTATGDINSGNNLILGSRNGAEFFEGQLYDFFSWSRLLSAAEVQAHHKTGQIEIADQWGKAPYVSDFTVDEDGFGNTNLTLTANTSPTGGGGAGWLQGDATTGVASFSRATTDAISKGQWCRLKIKAIIPTGNTSCDEVIFRGPSAELLKAGDLRVTPGAVDTEYELDVTFQSSIAFSSFRIYLGDGGSTTVTSGDTAYIKDVEIGPVGAVVALLSENIESDGSVVDASSNRLNASGTNTSALRTSVRLDLDDTNAATGETVLNVGTGFEVQKGGDVKAHSVALVDNSELTISSGSVTITSSLHNIDTEADAASDNLDTMSFSGDIGSLLLIRKNHPSRDIVIRHNVGNIITTTGADVTLDSSDSSIEHALFVWSGTEWVMLAVNTQGPA